MANKKSNKTNKSKQKKQVKPKETSMTPEASAIAAQRIKELQTQKERVELINSVETLLNSMLRGFILIGFTKDGGAFSKYNMNNAGGFGDVLFGLTYLRDMTEQLYNVSLRTFNKSSEEEKNV